MTRIEKQVVVESPREEVVRFARDWRNIPRYLNYIRNVRPLTDKTEGVGARLFVELRFLGRTLTTQWETVEYEPDSGWTYTAPLLGIVAQKRWRFEPSGDATLVTFTLDYDPSPPIVAPLADALLFRRRWNRMYERGLQNLKHIVESEASKNTSVTS